MQQKRRPMLIIRLAVRTSLFAISLAGVTIWPAAICAETAAMLLPGSENVAAPFSRPPATLDLIVDFAMVFKLDSDIGAIVLGNSTIADATVTNGRIVVLTGKSVGTTNMIVLGVDNAVLAQVTMQVGGRKPGTITVTRALERQNHACETGLCKDTDAAAPIAPPVALIAPPP